MNVPEEINRKIVDHISDVNITYSGIARDYLISEGLRKDMIIKLGSPMKEVLSFYQEEIKKSYVLKNLKLTKNQYFLVSTHREENVDNPSNLKKIINILNKISTKYSMPIIVSTHPRTKKDSKKLVLRFLI